jgi:hypothetical protein
VDSISDTKNLLFEKVNKVDRLLGRLTKIERQKTKMTNISNEKGSLQQNLQTSYNQILRSQSRENFESIKRKSMARHGGACLQIQLLRRWRQEDCKFEPGQAKLSRSCIIENKTET